MSKTAGQNQQKQDEAQKRGYTAPRLETRGKLQLVSGAPAGSYNPT